MLSMPRGTDPQTVLLAAREFAKIEFADHRYVMVVTRGPYRRRDPLWQVKAREEGRLRIRTQPTTTGIPAQPGREAALDAWKKIALALANSERREDQVLATEIVEFVRNQPIRRRLEQRQHQLEPSAAKRQIAQTLERDRSIAGHDRKGPEIER